MQLAWKEDWPECRQRLSAWWEGDAIDRAAILLVTRDRVVDPIVAPPTLEERWTDIDYFLRRNEAGSSFYYAGESIPSVFPNLGPGVSAAYMGSSITFEPSTCWFEQIVEDWDEFEYKITPDNRWWEHTKKMTQAAVDAGEGRYFVAHSDIGGPTDILSLLRGPDKLCIDLLERPEAVVRARIEVTKLWFHVYEKLYEIVNARMEGSCSWMGIWHPGKTYPLQCDFSCMISPELFQKYVLPELVEQAKFLDRTIYHLDGPGAIKHLDALLAAPEIDGIQWVPGAGEKMAVHWIPMLKKIQKAGKLVLCSAFAADARTLLEELSPRGLILSVGGVETREEADEMIAYARKVASDK